MPKISQLRPKVFICYCHQDYDKAMELYQCLQMAGADPWLDKKAMVDGDLWRDEIRKAVLRSDVMVVCLRPGFDDIGFRQQELHWAIKALSLRPPGRSFIIPFVVEPCEIPDWCEQYHVGNFNSRTSLVALVRAVSKHTATVLREPSEYGGIHKTADTPPLPVQSPSFPVSLAELKELQMELRARIHAQESNMLEVGPVGGTDSEDFVLLDELRDRCFEVERRIAAIEKEGMSEKEP